MKQYILPTILGLLLLAGILSFGNALGRSVGNGFATGVREVFLKKVGR